MVGDWWLAKPQWSSCHSTGVLPTPSTFDARCSHEFHTKIMWFETQCKSQHSQRSRFWSKGHCKHKRGKDWDPQWGAMAWLTWSWLRGFRDIGVAQERVIDERVVGSKVCPWKLKYECGGARRSWRASRRIHCQLGVLRQGVLGYGAIARFDGIRVEHPQEDTSQILDSAVLTAIWASWPCRWIGWVRRDLVGHCDGQPDGVTYTIGWLTVVLAPIPLAHQHVELHSASNNGGVDVWPVWVLKLENRIFHEDDGLNLKLGVNGGVATTQVAGEGYL